jgi:serine/threonine protein kinase
MKKTEEETHHDGGYREDVKPYVRSTEGFGRTRNGAENVVKASDAKQIKKRKMIHQRNEEPKFINEGTYGCIHRPPLRCEEPSNIHSYKNKISKLLTKKNIEREMQEYKKIQIADPHNLYHLGEPEICNLGMQSINTAPIEKCTMAPDVEKTPKDFQLILLKDGGNDLDHFIKNMQAETSALLPFRRHSANKTHMLEKCWIEMHRMLRGIRMFLLNDLVHHDVKYTNILYNTQKNRMNYIDFGMMENIKESIAHCKNNNYDWTNNWWYFPYETNFLDAQKFYQGQRMNRHEITTYVHGNLNKDVWFPTLIRMTKLTKTESDKLLQDYKDYLNTDFKTISHHLFLIRYFSTLDIYGLGILFLQILQNSDDAMSPIFKERMKALALRMISFNLKRRILIEECMTVFEQILESTGIMEKYNLRFQSHRIIKITVPRKKLPRYADEFVVGQ